MFSAVSERGLEGVVAKKLSDSYRPGRRDWIKTKNRSYWRYPREIGTVAKTMTPISCLHVDSRFELVRGLTRFPLAEKQTH
jgi:hypothetical protein